LFLLICILLTCLTFLFVFENVYIFSSSSIIRFDNWLSGNSILILASPFIPVLIVLFISFIFIIFWFYVIYLCFGDENCFPTRPWFIYTIGKLFYPSKLEWVLFIFPRIYNFAISAWDWLWLFGIELIPLAYIFYIRFIIFSGEFLVMSILLMDGILIGYYKTNFSPCIYILLILFVLVIIWLNLMQKCIFAAKIYSF